MRKPWLASLAAASAAPSVVTERYEKGAQIGPTMTTPSHRLVGADAVTARVGALIR